MTISNSKKSQLFIIGGFFLLLGLVFIYSLETENHYIIFPSKSQLLSNIENQMCQIAHISNGSYLDSRFADFETKAESYCQSIGTECDLQISKSSSAPTDLHLLDYTYYNFSISYENGGFAYNSGINCG